MIKNINWANVKIEALSGEPLIASVDGASALRCFATTQWTAAQIEDSLRLHSHLRQDPKRLKLERNLLRFGGCEVNLQACEPHLDVLISERAMVWDGAVTKRIRGGERGYCHCNVACHFERQKRPRWRIATGYALSAHGSWVQHSWLCSEKLIGETTGRWVAYAGVVLDDVESVVFWLRNRKDPLPVPPPAALRLQDSRIEEGVMYALDRCQENWLIRAFDYLIELEGKDDVSQESAGPTQLPAE